MIKTFWTAAAIVFIIFLFTGNIVLSNDIPYFKWVGPQTKNSSSVTTKVVHADISTPASYSVDATPTPTPGPSFVCTALKTVYSDCFKK